jgi:uncharacterized protein (TIGR03067 family)
MSSRAQRGTSVRANVRNDPKSLAALAMTTDIEKLQGRWFVTSLQIDGAEQPFDDAMIVVDGSRFVATGMGDEYTGIVTLSLTKKPKTIDLAFTAGPPAGTTNRGIYKLDGDVWTLCLATRGDARPRGFRTRENTGHALETLGRAAVRSNVTPRAFAPPDMPNGSPSVIDGEWAMVSAVLNGTPLAPEMVKYCTRITRGGVTKIIAGGNTMLDASFTLDPALGHIDYVNRSGKQNGKSQAGIYELTGHSLRICTAAPGKPRPTDFTSVKGDGRSFTEWQRAKR